MRKLTMIGGVFGIALAVTAYFAELRNWMSPEAFITIGLAGYVLVITAVAYFLLSWLTKGLKEDLEVL
ncbi:hypothetical protein ACWKWU_20560 [Chitinophaga lutea]